MDINKATPAQRAIVDLSTGQHLVLAPPGSGKTDILALRLNAAIKSGVDADEMLCVTFTNRAARNMRNRVGDIKGKQPFVGTLHTFGYRFLIANRLIPANTNLLDEEDAETLLEDCIKLVHEDQHINTELKVTDAIQYARLYEQQRLQLKEIAQDFRQDAFTDAVADRYRQLKQQCCCIDFDDVLHLMLHAIQHGSATALHGYKWAQIDEVQDLSKLQWLIVKGLLSDTAHVIYLGDYDQSIFSFMGASHQTLGEFTSGLQVHHLEENFRSPPTLIDFFNDFAAANLPSRKELVLRPGNREGVIDEGKVRIINVSGEFGDEAHKIASRLIPTLISKYARSAVLTRTNNDADVISEQLRQNTIDHFRVSGYDLFRRRVIKDSMAFLRALQFPLDRFAWARMFAVFGGVTSIRAARDLVNDMYDAGMTPLDCFDGDYLQSPMRQFLHTMNSGRCVLFDTETTGLDTNNADIIQIAAIEFIDGKPTGQEFEVFLLTNQDLTETAKVHGIDSQLLFTKGVDPHIGLKKFIDFCADSCVAGHNVQFDLSMISSNLSRVGLEWCPKGGVFDTLSLARVLHPRLQNYKLGYLLEMLKVEGTNSHNALDDVRATGHLARRLLADTVANTSKRDKVRYAYQKNIARFVDGLEPLWRDLSAMRERNDQVNLSQVIDLFFQYAEQHARYSMAAGDEDHVSVLTNYLKQSTSTQSLGTLLAELLPELSTYSEADLISGDEKVVVSTVHKAKGLEFDAVVVTSCVQDIYPHFYSKTPDKVEEDARLLYVALTRAKVAIAITTHDQSTNKWGKTFPRWPSHFLNFITSAS